MLNLSMQGYNRLIFKYFLFGRVWKAISLFGAMAISRRNGLRPIRHGEMTPRHFASANSRAFY